jgi:phosphatidylserine decarboxylase
MDNPKKTSLPIVYYQNETLVSEINPSQGILQFLYHNPIGKILRRIARRRWISSLVGAYYNSSASKHKIEPFIKLYNINMDEYEKPANDYTSFNDFFIRKLKPNTRQIDQGLTSIISPADSKVLVIPDISVDTPFLIKQQPFNLAQFLKDPALAAQYTHGTMMIFRLAPYDYHHFHFPVNCTPSASYRIKGLFESVNPIAFQSTIQPLLENERHLIMLKTEIYDTIAMVLVGALIVGKIIETYAPHKAYKKGDLAGHFAFGGSTVVLLFKQNTVKPAQNLIQHSLQGIETAVKMGSVVNE